MLENLRLAREFTEGLSSAAELAANQKTLYAVIRALEVVGEATKRVPQEIRDRAPGVPWAAMAGMLGALCATRVSLAYTRSTATMPLRSRSLKPRSMTYASTTYVMVAA